MILAERAVRAFIGAGEAPPESDFLEGSGAAPRRVRGLEHRLSLCYERLETLFDSLPDAALTLDPGIDDRREAWLAQIADGFDARAALQRNGRATGTLELTPLEPRHLYLDEAELQDRMAERVLVTFTDAADAVRLTVDAVPRFAEAADPGRTLAEYLRGRQEAGDRTLLAAPDRRTQSAWPTSSSAGARGRSSAWSTGPRSRAWPPTRREWPSSTCPRASPSEGWW